MKTFLLTIALMFGLGLSAADKPEDIAFQAVQNFLAGNLEAVHSLSNDWLKAAITPQMQAQTRGALTAQYGKLQTIHPAKPQPPSNQAYIVKCEFDQAVLSFLVNLNEQQKVAAFVINQVDKKFDLENTDVLSEEQIVFGDGKKLPGVLTVPKGQADFPLVILVHGSGPQDYDETVGSNKVFRDIAHGLAKRGVGVFRYSKRTLVYPGMVSTVEDEVIDDVVHAFGMLKERGFKKIYVLGHSLGGMLIPRIAAKLGEGAAGYIALAAPARPMEDLMVEQTEYIASIAPAAMTQAAMTKVEVAKIKKLTADSKPHELILHCPVSYWLDLKDYNQVAMAASITRPVFYLQGGRDYQVTMVDFEIYRDKLSMKPNFKFKAYPDLNHLFMTGQGKSTPMEYGIKGRVSEDVLDDIGSFMKQPPQEVR